MAGLILGTSGCYFNKAEISNRNLLEGKRAVFIYAHDDPMAFKEGVKKGLIGLGFSITDVKSEADLAVDYSGVCGWDVFHYTCSSIRLFVTDRASGEVLVKARFGGGVPFSVETILDILFKEIEAEIKQGS
ncbi:MAG: hypothetical protein LLG97_13190 [Deltaproteobacteria bacterium]|nr:hypothetical protein [Deltaproteobacteria bacterium]